MGLISTQNHLVFAFGLLGNITSFVVFLAPIPTFIRVCKKKSTEGFHSFPYVASLFSAMAWLYYASIKSDVFLLATINSFGCFIEAVYISLFIAYAPKQARISTLRMLLLLNFGGFCLLLLLSHFLAKGSVRIQVLGWICVTFSVFVFAAPLSIIRVVIRTKSVEFLPFYLSFFLSLSAIMWFLYGILLKDYCIAAPNVVGLTFAIVQMILYVIYKNYNTGRVLEDNKLPQNMTTSNGVDDVNLSTITCEVAEVVSPHHPNVDENGAHKKENMHFDGDGDQSIACQV